jgi:hypothetical protein
MEEPMSEANTLHPSSVSYAPAAAPAAPATPAPNSEAGQAPAKKRGRGPDKKPRKPRKPFTRSDNPAKYLPKTADAHRIAKERGKTVGRPRGSRNGWTKAERALNWEVARAKAKLEVDFWEAVGAWPTAEQRAILYRSIDRGLWQRWTAMLDKRREAALLKRAASRETIA